MMQRAAAGSSQVTGTATTVPVTVVIPAYGDSPHLPELVATILQGTCLPVEIIISHSGTHDPSRLLSGTDPRVRVTHQDDRLWAAAARNRGASHATGDWLAFVDSDVRPGPAWLETLIARTRNDDRAFVVGSVGYATSGGYWGLCNWACEFSEQFPWLTPRIQAGGASCNMIVSRPDFEAAGRFPENFKCGEDTMLFSSLRKTGAKQAFEPMAKVDHYNLPGFLHFISHQYELGYHSARVRQNYRLKGHSATRHPLLALLLWLPRLALVSRRLASGGPTWCMRSLALLPGIVVGSWSWTAGFLKRVLDTAPPGNRDAT